MLVGVFQQSIFYVSFRRVAFHPRHRIFICEAMIIPGVRSSIRTGQKQTNSGQGHEQEYCIARTVHVKVIAKALHVMIDLQICIKA